MTWMWYIVCRYTSLQHHNIYIYIIYIIPGAVTSLIFFWVSGLKFAQPKKNRAPYIWRTSQWTIHFKKVTSGVFNPKSFGKKMKMVNFHSSWHLDCEPPWLCKKYRKSHCSLLVQVTCDDIWYHLRMVVDYKNWYESDVPIFWSN